MHKQLLTTVCLLLSLKSFSVQLGEVSFIEDKRIQRLEQALPYFDSQTDGFFDLDGVVLEEKSKVQWPGLLEQNQTREALETARQQPLCRVFSLTARLASGYLDTAEIMNKNQVVWSAVDEFAEHRVLQVASEKLPPALRKKSEILYHQGVVSTGGRKDDGIVHFYKEQKIPVLPQSLVFIDNEDFYLQQVRGLFSSKYYPINKDFVALLRENIERVTLLHFCPDKKS
jgi:hypothetical protein